MKVNKIEMFNWLRKNKLLFLVLLFLYSGAGLVQDSSTDPKTENPPSVTALEARWWQFFESSKDHAEADLKISLFLEKLEADIQEYSSVNLEDKPLEKVKTLFERYTNKKYDERDEVNSSTTLEALKQTYSLSEVMDLAKEKNLIISRQSKTQELLKSAEQDLSILKKEIDGLKVLYFQESETSEKVSMGLNWVKLRIQAAIQAEEGSQLQTSLQSLKLTMSEFDILMQSAISRLSAKDNSLQIPDEKAFNKQLLSQDKRIGEINTEIVDLKDTSDEGFLKRDILQLKLAQASVDRYQLLAKHDQKKLEYHIYTILNQDEQGDATVQDVISNSESLASEFQDAMNQWRETSQNAILAPLESDTSKAIMALDRNKRKLANELVASYEKARQEFNTDGLLRSILQHHFDSNQSVSENVWNNLMQFASGTKQIITNLIYEPLFTINEYPVSLLPLIKLLLIILIGYLISKFVTMLIARYERRNKIKNSSSLYLMHRLIHYTIIFIATMAGFGALGINLSNVALIAGALSVGIGFGLQNLVSNFVSGLTIMFEKSVSVGDYIELDDGTTGQVKEIRARSTQINTNDNIDIIIPNADMVTQRVTNWTLKESVRRIKVPFGVAYGTDKELVRKAALEAAGNVQYTLQNQAGKEPEVWLTEFGDNSVNFFLLVWVSHYGLRRPNRMKGYYLWELDTVLQKYNIEIPFPQRVVHMKHQKESESDSDLLDSED